MFGLVISDGVIVDSRLATGVFSIPLPFSILLKASIIKNCPRTVLVSMDLISAKTLELVHINIDAMISFFIFWILFYFNINLILNPHPPVVYECTEGAWSKCKL